MMDSNEIENLMQLMQKHGFNELELKTKEQKIKLVQRSSSSLVQPMAMPSYSQPLQPHNFYSANQQVENSQSPMQPASSPSGAQVNEQEKKPHYKEIRSPFVGTFYESASPGADPFIEVGQSIQKGDTLCIVEAMKLMNEIEAEFSGKIAKILIKNEEPVEFDQVLFWVE